MDLDKYIYAFVLLLNLVVIADFVDVITMESDWRMCLFIFVILYIMYYRPLAASVTTVVKDLRGGQPSA